MAAPPEAPIEAGSLFHGRYRVERCIGAGAMGAVYEVLDETTKSRRALKVMLRDAVGDQVQHERFALEAQITGGIESDHIVRVLDAGIDAATQMPFLTMELLRGETLRELLRSQGALPPPNVAIFLRQVALGLSKTHAAGIVHRDLKPDNLFVTMRDDGSPCVKILDFGIAKVAARSHQGSATRIGTPLYMAPEQISGRGAIGPWTDLFALAHIAYELLVGEHYFREESTSAETPLEFYHRILAGLVEAPSARALRRAGKTLPPGFDEWMGHAAAPQPEDRFSGAMEQIGALAAVLDPSVPGFGSTNQAAPITGPVSVPAAALAPAPWAASSSSPSLMTPRGVDTAGPSVRTLPMESTGPRASQVPGGLPLVPTLGLPPAPAATGSSGRTAIAAGAAVLILGSAAVVAGFASLRNRGEASPPPPAPASVATTNVVVPPPAVSTVVAPEPSASIDTTPVEAPAKDAGPPVDAGSKVVRPAKRALPNSVDGF